VPNGTRQCDGPGVSWDIVVDAMNIVSPTFQLLSYHFQFLKIILNVFQYHPSKTELAPEPEKCIVLKITKRYPLQLQSYQLGP